MPMKTGRPTVSEASSGASSSERRRLPVDRRSMWRGSRRDEDWVRRFATDASGARAGRRAAIDEDFLEEVRLHWLDGRDTVARVDVARLVRTYPVVLTLTEEPWGH